MKVDSFWSVSGRGSVRNGCLSMQYQGFVLYGTYVHILAYSILFYILQGHAFGLLFDDKLYFYSSK